MYYYNVYNNARSKDTKLTKKIFIRMWKKFITTTYTKNKQIML